MAADGTQTAADQTRRALNDLTWKIIGAAHKVSRTLGVGFLEKVYENALCVELRKRGLSVEQQKPVEVRYEQEIVGAYVTDVLVDGRVIVELKAQPALDRNHHAQCVHYLRATGFSLCLLLNFGRPHMEIRRIVHHF